MVLDIIFIGVSYLAIHLGLKRGLVGAAIGFFGWFAAFVFAIKLVPWGTGVINSLVGFDLQINPLIAFVILLYLGWKIVRSIGQSSSSKVSDDIKNDVNVFNALAGSGLYWVAFVLTMSIFVRAAETYNLMPEQVKRGSRTYSQILTKYPDGATRIIVYMLPFLKEGWNHLDEAIGKIDTSLQEGLPDAEHHVTTSAPDVAPPPPTNAPPDNQSTVEPSQPQPLQPLNYDDMPRATPRRYKEEE
jgi:hypothetical protein